MARRYKLVEAKALGRRLFIKAGGAVVLAAAIPACDDEGTTSAGVDVPLSERPGPDDVSEPSDASEPPMVDASRTDDVPSADAEGAELGPETEQPLDTEVSVEPEPCEAWTPDPLGEDRKSVV